VSTSPSFVSRVASPQSQAIQIAHPVPGSTLRASLVPSGASPAGSRSFTFYVHPFTNLLDYLPTEMVVLWPKCSHGTVMATFTPGTRRQEFLGGRVIWASLSSGEGQAVVERYLSPGTGGPWS
jgi:hypothetical protein